MSRLNFEKANKHDFIKNERVEAALGSMARKPRYGTLQHVDMGSEIEGYKQYWKEHGFPDISPYSYQGSHITTGIDSTDPTYQPIPEQELWAAVVREAIRDAKGLGPDAKLSCESCHVTVDCACLARHYKKSEVVNYDPTLGLRVKVGARTHLLALRYVTEQDDGSYIYKRLLETCSAAHTYQDCAKRFLASAEFEELCNALSVDVSVARKAAA